MDKTSLSNTRHSIMMLPRHKSLNNPDFQECVDTIRNRIFQICWSKLLGTVVYDTHRYASTLAWKHWANRCSLAAFSQRFMGMRGDSLECTPEFHNSEKGIQNPKTQTVQQSAKSHSVRALLSDDKKLKRLELALRFETRFAVRNSRCPLAGYIYLGTFVFRHTTKWQDKVWPFHHHKGR